MLDKTTREVRNHVARYCIVCTMKLSFSGLLKTQTCFYQVLPSTGFVHIEMSKTRYECLERIWNDKRIALLCCNCCSFMEREPELVSELMNDLACGVKPSNHVRKLF